MKTSRGRRGARHHWRFPGAQQGAPTPNLPPRHPNLRSHRQLRLRLRLRQHPTRPRFCCPRWENRSPRHHLLAESGRRAAADEPLVRVSTDKDDPVPPRLPAFLEIKVNEDEVAVGQVLGLVGSPAAAPVPQPHPAAPIVVGTDPPASTTPARAAQEPAAPAPSVAPRASVKRRLRLPRWCVRWPPTWRSILSSITGTGVGGARPQTGRAGRRRGCQGRRSCQGRRRSCQGCRAGTGGDKGAPGRRRRARDPAEGRRPRTRPIQQAWHQKMSRLHDHRCADRRVSTNRSATHRHRRGDRPHRDQQAGAR